MGLTLINCRLNFLFNFINFQDGFDVCIENLSDEMKEDYLLSVKKAIGKKYAGNTWIPTHTCNVFCFFLVSHLSTLF